MKHSGVFLVVLAFLMLTLIPSLGHSERVHFSEYHFSIEVPEGWVEIPVEELPPGGSVPGVPATSDRIVSVAAFQPPTDEWFSVPYFLLAYANHPNIDFDEMVVTMAKVAREQALPSLRATEFGREAGLYGPVPDPKGPSVMTAFKRTQSPIGYLTIRQLAFPGSAGIAYLYLFAPAELFSSSPELFWGIQNGFAFDDGFEYSGKPMDSLQREATESKSKRTLLLRISAVVALVIAVAVTLLTRKKRAADT